MTERNYKEYPDGDAQELLPGIEVLRADDVLSMYRPSVNAQAQRRLPLPGVENVAPSRALYRQMRMTFR